MPIRRVKRLLKRKIFGPEEGFKVTNQDAYDALKYIDNYWHNLIRENYHDSGSLIGLPNPYLVPATGSDEFNFEEQYYWDSYFTALGLTDKEDESLVEGMLDNLIYLLDRFELIPNASRMYFLGRSQPPLLTTYIFHIYDNYERSDSWLRQKIEKAQKEYETVWMSTKHPHWRQVESGLSRYYDINVLHDLAEAESGWDMTSRFNRRCLDYVPIDLNSLLYKYESDFVRAAEILDDDQSAKKWRQAAAARKKAVNNQLWVDTKRFYFDYNYITRRHSNTYSLAAYYAMWAGLVDDRRAKQLVRQLDNFETSHGLTTTMKPAIELNLFGSLKAQWAYPNGWAPLHYFVIEGLERYGYHDIAQRIAHKWIATNLNWFKKNGEFQEKYNVINPNKPPQEGVYPSQHGFGWTNGVFVHLVDRYSK